MEGLSYASLTSSSPGEAIIEDEYWYPLPKAHVKEREVMSDQMIKLLDAVINVIREIKAATQKDGMSRQAMVDYLDHMLDRLEDIKESEA